MHIKNIHCMIEKLAEYCKCDIEKGYEELDVAVVGDAVDMLKDLCEAEYYARIAKAMEKEEEEDEAEEKYFLKMLKEEKEDEYKKMKEEYGEDEGERRFYDNYRYKSSGRFAPKGRGSYMPRGSRRGYEEPPYYHVMPKSAEWDRDMDRVSMNRMYYSEGGQSSDGNMGGQSANSGNMGGNTRSYSDGYDEGTRRGYEDGYRDGERIGRNSGNKRDGREGRSGQSRRTYMETKEMNRGNSPQEKQEKMKELEKYMGELGSDITEMISDASNEEKTMLKSKLQTLVQKIQ